jgi:nicotinate-nucleotide--dimethylbenzimidazole phosphoribosyltransferase
MQPAIAALVQAIQPLDAEAMRSARARQEQLTKPPGALGRLEDLSVQLAGIFREPLPTPGAGAIVVAAADHGVARHGVSAYPPEVTAQMVLNFLAGGAAVNVLARQANARVVIVDAGVDGALPDHPALLRRARMRGCNDIAAGPAMSRATAELLLLDGATLASELVSEGAGLVSIGDMGIGNTTPSAAITAAFTRLSAELVTGRGTGVSDERLAGKVARVQAALAVNQVDPTDPVGVLAGVGGLEIGFLAGVCLGAAAAQRPVIVDGFIATAAALIAQAIAPELGSYLIAAHRSAERGHHAALAHLGLEPLLDLNMRLGEGTGAALAMGIVRAAAAILREMATFADAGVSGSDQATPSGE